MGLIPAKYPCQLPPSQTCPWQKLVVLLVGDYSGRINLEGRKWVSIDTGREAAGIEGRNLMVAYGDPLAA